MTPSELIGWDRLRHGGLLLDPPRLRRIAEPVPEPLSSALEYDIRRLAGAILDGSGSVPDFVTFVLEDVCRFTAVNGSWQRGSQVAAEWGRRAVTGETVKPRQLWRGAGGAVVPVFLDPEPRLGIGRGRKTASQTVQWLRAGTERLAVLTNGRQWRLIFAGLDFDAWCEWDVDLWLAEGGLSPQVQALRTLLSPGLWTPSADDAPAPLLQAILDSRKGQAELSAVLGERVREAVEQLVQSHGEVLKERCADVAPADIYRAAVRVVMRLVVVLFAESRELLPRDNALYHGAYGLTGLLAELEKVAARGGNRLARSWNAWPRVLGLFRLVHQGSHHPTLPVTAYGGELFAPGDAASSDGLSRTIAVFEGACFDREMLSDREVHAILERITRTRVKVRQGWATTSVPAPVDFSDFSSEYIGILYEGLLDFELKTAPPGDPVVFLAVGNQPALPLSRLEAMDDKTLANLLETMRDTTREVLTEDSEVSEDQESSAGDNGDGDESGEDEAAAAREESESHGNDERHATRTRAEMWARRAAEVGKLVPRPKAPVTAEKRLAYEEALSHKARQLVLRVILPGEWYLVRWGGTRKGSGTFYTRPGLAVPTVQRTLRPLAYTAPVGLDNTDNLDAPHSAWTPRTPDEILALKVCDPACGSGTFPIAALRFLTEALYASLHHHGRVASDGDRAVVRLLAGGPAGSESERLGEELLPCRPDDAQFEPRLKAILRRHVVERSIYGVDLDPLAVELCRLALWIETMDRTLPFSFLDHKIKCGNALVGAWFDQFQHYPVMAWKNREGGDKNHTNGVHFSKDARGQALRSFVKDTLTPDLRHFLEGRTLFSEDKQEKVAAVHAAALAILSGLHDLPVQDAAARARIYREKLLGSTAFHSLRAAMDLWCACWFWPTDRLSDAPLPTTLGSPTEATHAIAHDVAARQRFFHWELEFPDVFRDTDSGFDAILGNPPWDIAKPNSKEFFSNIDPLYRSYGKQEALSYQTEYFRDESIERTWIEYNADFRAQSNLMKFVDGAFGDPDHAEDPSDRFSIAKGKENATLHGRWRSARTKSRGFADPAHPFRHQGSADINLYKAFLEQAHALLHPTGRLGFIVPSGLYSDHGTGGLRRLFLDRCRWEWLFGFENRDGVFDIDSRFKFNPIIIEKGGRTAAIRTAFMRRKLEDWAGAEPLATPYSREQIERFSPRSKAILEIQSRRDLEVLEKIYANSVLLGEEGPDGWGLKYATEFHMTNDSKLFPPRPKWEAEGYRPDEYSRWLKGNWRPIAELWAELGVKPLTAGDRRCAQPPYDKLPIPRADIPAGIILSREADSWFRIDGAHEIGLPLYEGRMIGQFDFSQKGWISGKGRTAVWRDIPWGEKQIEPQYLIGAADLSQSGKGFSGPKIAYMRISSSTNSRTTISTYLRGSPAGDSVFFFLPERAHTLTACVVSGLLSSFAFDMVIRQRLGGLNMSEFVMVEAPLPHRLTSELSFAASLLLATSLPNKIFAREWISLAPHRSDDSWRKQWAITAARRLQRLVCFDAITASWYGLTADDIQRVFIDCDHPTGVASANFDPKGFWRVDRDADPELRRTVLTLVAFHELDDRIRSFGGSRAEGIKSFLSQNNGEGWMLPETLRLADYGLGHDERAKHPQPVASRLGPRFHDWQLAQSAEESWGECHLHARNLSSEAGYQDVLASAEPHEHVGERRPTARLQSSSQPATTQHRLFE